MENEASEVRLGAVESLIKKKKKNEAFELRLGAAESLIIYFYF